MHGWMDGWQSVNLTYRNVDDTSGSLGNDARRPTSGSPGGSEGGSCSRRTNRGMLYYYQIINAAAEGVRSDLVSSVVPLPGPRLDLLSDARWRRVCVCACTPRGHSNKCVWLVILFCSPLCIPVVAKFIHSATLCIYFLFARALSDRQLFCSSLQGRIH